MIQKHCYTFGQILSLKDILSPSQFMYRSIINPCYLGHSAISVIYELWRKSIAIGAIKRWLQNQSIRHLFLLRFSSVLKPHILLSVVSIGGNFPGTPFFGITSSYIDIFYCISSTYWNILSVKWDLAFEEEKDARCIILGIWCLQELGKYCLVKNFWKSMITHGKFLVWWVDYATHFPSKYCTDNGKLERKL